MSKIKKSISVFTSITTILWLSGIAMLVPVQVSAADIIDGDIMRNPNAEGMAQFDVYIAKIVGEKKFKRLILSPHVFESYGHLEWGNIKEVDAATMDAYTTSDLVRADGDTKVYKLTADGDTGTKQWLNMTAAEFEAQGYDWDSIYIINTVDRDAYTTGSDITTAEEEEEEEEVVSEGTLTVALAADTPAATLVPQNAARVPFTKVTLTATGGDVTVDSLTMERTGTAQDSNFSSLCVINADTKEKIGLDKTLNASHQAVLNDDIKVESGTTKTLIIAGNMASSLQAGEVPTLSLVAMTLKGEATLNATLPITGNAMTMNTTITIATVTLGTGGSNPTSDNAPKIGQTDVNFTEIKISNTSSNEKTQLEQIKWTNYGSADDDDVQNIDLVDSATGQVLMTANQMTDQEVIFTFDEPIVIGKGLNKSFMIRGDTVDGAARTVDMSIEKYTDILIKGQLYGFYVTPTAGTNAQSSEPRIDGQAHTIGEGTLKVSQAAIAASNIAEGATQQVLGAFDFTVKGESIAISQIGIQTHINLLTAGTGATTSDITNLTVYDSDGNVVAGPKDPSFDYGDGDNAYGSATTTDTITVPVGTTTYTIKGDLSSDFASGDTIDVSITPGANITAKGETTGKSITATPSTVQTSVTQTVKVGEIVVSLSPNVAAASVVKGTTQHTFAKLVLDATGSGEDVNVSQVQVTVKPTNALSNELSNFKIYDGDTELSISNDSDSDLTNDSNAATSTFSLVNTLTIAKGTSKTLTVKADISRDTSEANSDSFKVGIGGYNNVTATGAITGSSITPTYSASDGATMTIKDTGEITIYTSSATPKSGLIPANSSGLTVGVFNVSAKYEDINLEKIYFTASQVDSKGGLDQIDTFYLYDGASLIASVTPTSSDGADKTVLVDMTANPLTIGSGVSKDITIKVDTSPADRFNNLGPGTAGQGFNLKINAVGDVTAKGVSSGTALASGSKTVSVDMKSFTVYKSVPTVTLNEDLGTAKVSSGTLTAGTETGKELYKFKVAADAKGDIGLYRVQFLVTTSTATVTNLYLYDETAKQATASSTIDVITTGITGTGFKGIVTFYLTNDGLVPDAQVDAATNVVPYTVSANDSNTFTVKGDVECDSTCQSTTRTGSVQVQFLGDGAMPSIAGTTGYPDGANDLNDELYENSFIWSDYNITLSNSSTTASSSEQWTNAYRVASGGGGKLSATSSAVTFTK